MIRKSIIFALVLGAALALLIASSPSLRTPEAEQPRIGSQAADTGESDLDSAGGVVDDALIGLTEREVVELLGAPERRFEAYSLGNEASLTVGYDGDDTVTSARGPLSLPSELIDEDFDSDLWKTLTDDERLRMVRGLNASNNDFLLAKTKGEVHELLGPPTRPRVSLIYTYRRGEANSERRRQSIEDSLHLVLDCHQLNIMLPHGRVTETRLRRHRACHQSKHFHLGKAVADTLIGQYEAEVLKLLGVPEKQSEVYSLVDRAVLTVSYDSRGIVLRAIGPSRLSSDLINEDFGSDLWKTPVDDERLRMVRSLDTRYNDLLSGKRRDEIRELLGAPIPGRGSLVYVYRHGETDSREGRRRMEDSFGVSIRPQRQGIRLSVRIHDGTVTDTRVGDLLVQPD